MKRNLLPLLAVAFVVAVASTGIFYTLFVGKLKSAPRRTVVAAANPLAPGTVIAKSDLGSMIWASAEVPKGMYTNIDQVSGQTVVQAIAQGEPVFESRLVSKPGTGFGVPAGMRAVSVHVSDSSGVLALLKPGHRVDVQVFAKGQAAHGNENEARTAFQNVKVLTVGTQAEPSSQGGFNAPVVTLVVNPRDADGLGLADSFGRIRLALRNPVDDGTEIKGALPLAAVFRSPVAPAPSAAAAAPVAVRRPAQAAARLAPSQVGLAVELLSVSAEGIRELKRHGVNGRADMLDASQVAASADLDRTLAMLRDRKAVDVLSNSRLNAVMSRSAAVELRGEQAGGLRVRFSPFLANGQVKLKVEPEIQFSGGPAPGSRRLATEVDITSGRSFFISGFDPGAAAVDGRQLLVLVKPNL